MKWVRALEVLQVTYLTDPNNRGYVLSQICIYLKNLKRKLRKKELPAGCRCIKGIVSDLKPDEKFDTILYIDVLEHIKDDSKELIETVRHLSPGGHLIILVPAHQYLFNEFDKAIGHYRRYNKKVLTAAIPPEMQLKKIKYMDSMGFMASLANKFFLKQNYPTLKQINIWDKLIIPASRISDIVAFNSFGKSLIGVWQKPL